MTKRALIVGIDYKGTSNELRGCINDAFNMKKLYEARGFTDIRMVIENEATTNGIIAALDDLTKKLTPGDVAVFHYSGHGSQLPSRYEKDGYEEIICPIDLDWEDNVITDDTLKAIFNTIPNGVNITLILDCCHSGTMLDQIESLAEEELLAPPPDVILPKVEEDPRYLPPPKKILNKLKNRALVEWSTSRDVNQTALLIAGCKEHQTSADAYIDGSFQGAASYALRKILEAKSDISYRELVREMNIFMINNGFTQRPALDGSSLLYEEKFTEPYSTKIQSVSNWEDPPTEIESDPEPEFVYQIEPEEEKKSVNKELMIGVAILVVFIIAAIVIA